MRTVFLMISLLVNLFIYSNVSDGERVIELSGDTELPQTKSSSFPLKAYTEGNAVFVQFYIAMTDVTITLTSSEGETESRTVSFTEFQTEAFYIDHPSQGMYHITITTPRGTNLYGTFYIK